MLKSVEFMSLKAVKSLASSPTVAIISIRDSSSVRDLPTFDGFMDVLPLDMLDVCEEHALHAPWSWADEPTGEQHFQHIVHAGGVRARAVYQRLDGLQVG